MGTCSTFAYHGRGGWSTQPPALDSPRTLVVAFAAPEFGRNPAPLDELRKAYPTSAIIGCSSAGEIHGVRLHDQSIAVGVMRFDRTRLLQASESVPDMSASRRVGAALGRQLADPELRGVFVLSDGLRINGSELVRGLADVLPAHVILTGGLAGDGSRFAETWVLDRSGQRPGVVSAIGFAGSDIYIGHGSKGGWDPFGPERLITRASGNVLHELDRRPALALYKTYLGDRAEGLPATGLLFPLCLRRDLADQRRLVRTILAVDEATQSITFAGDVPEGCLAQLMRANFDRLIAGAAGSAVMCASDRQARGPSLAIAVSCVGRRLVLGERIEEELEATADALPSDAAQIGYYSYGEISPYTSGSCDLHNQTMTMTLLAES